MHTDNARFEEIVLEVRYDLAMATKARCAFQACASSAVAWARAYDMAIECRKALLTPSVLSDAA